MKSVLSYSEKTNTIRQFPENYVIAGKLFDHSEWICQPDLAADKQLCMIVFRHLLEYENKYQKDGLKLLGVLTSDKEYKELLNENKKINNHFTNIIRKIKDFRDKAYKKMDGKIEQKKLHIKKLLNI